MAAAMCIAAQRLAAQLRGTAPATTAEHPMFLPKSITNRLESAVPRQLQRLLGGAMSEWALESLS